MIALLLAGCGSTAVRATSSADYTAAEAKADGPAMASTLREQQTQDFLHLAAGAWCEGDHEFLLDHIACGAGTAACTRGVTVYANTGVNPPRDSRTCSIDGIHGSEDVVDTADGSQTLSDDFWLKLDAGLAEIEDNLP
jgi:hypothetical protein